MKGRFPSSRERTPE